MVRRVFASLFRPQLAARVLRAMAVPTPVPQDGDVKVVSGVIGITSACPHAWLLPQLRTTEAANASSLLLRLCQLQSLST